MQSHLGRAGLSSADTERTATSLGRLCRGARPESAQVSRLPLPRRALQVEQRCPSWPAGHPVHDLATPRAHQRRAAVPSSDTTSSGSPETSCRSDLGRPRSDLSVRRCRSWRFLHQRPVLLPTPPRPRWRSDRRGSRVGPSRSWNGSQVRPVPQLGAGRVCHERTTRVRRTAVPVAG